MTTIVHLSAYRSPRARMKIPAPHFPTGVAVTLFACAIIFYGAFLLHLVAMAVYP